MNRCTSRRSKETPLGDVSNNFDYVNEANVFVDRMVMLILFGVATGVHWVVEQPSSSILFCHPAWIHLANLSNSSVLQLYSVNMWMGMLGATTPKASTLKSSCYWITETRKKLDRSLFSRSLGQTYRHLGDGKVEGGKMLKETQAYPFGYGVLLRKLWEKRRKLAGDPCLTGSPTAVPHIWDASIMKQLEQMAQ
jgi:hypothetical protein